MINKTSEENQKRLLKSLLYYVLAVKDEKTVESISDLLEYDQKVIQNLLDGFPANHPAVINFNKIKSVDYRDFEIISNELKSKVKQAKMIRNTFPDFCNEVEVDVYIEKVISSNKFETMREYINYLMKKGDSRGFLVIGFRLFYDEGNVELGLKYMEQSATQGNLLAFYYLGVIYYEGGKGKVKKDYEKAEKYLKQFIEKEKRRR